IACRRPLRSPNLTRGVHVSAASGSGRLQNQTDGVSVGFIFFFKAEDGIRDRNVTGVQTCALPISLWLKCIRFFPYVRITIRSVNIKQYEGIFFKHTVVPYKGLTHLRTKKRTKRVKSTNFLHKPLTIP